MWAKFVKHFKHQHFLLTIKVIVFSCLCSDLNKEKTFIYTFIPVHNHLLASVAVAPYHTPP